MIVRISHYYSIRRLNGCLWPQRRSAPRGVPATSMATQLDADTVAQLLRDKATRGATLDALETSSPVERTVSLAAAPALTELLALDASEVGPEQCDRVGLLLARLVVDASDDPALVSGSALCGGRLAALFRSQREGTSACGQLLCTRTRELTRSDAQHLACAYAMWGSAGSRGWTKVWAAAGFATSMKGIQLFMSEHPLSK